MKIVSLPSPKPEAFKEYESHSVILKSISDKFEDKSIERELLKRAAFALLFSTAYFSDEFDRFLTQIRTELTENEAKRMFELDHEASTHAHED